MAVQLSRGKVDGSPKTPNNAAPWVLFLMARSLSLDVGEKQMIMP